MSVSRALCAGVLAALALPAAASPIFQPSSYSATIGAGAAIGLVTPIVSTTDMNTYLSVVTWSGLSVLSEAGYDAPNNRLMVNVGGLPPFMAPAASRASWLLITFVPSGDATLTLGGVTGNSPLAGSDAVVREGGSTLLSFTAGTAPTSTSLQVYAGHAYQLELHASVYNSQHGAHVYAELSDPVPAPAGAALLAATGVLAAFRRRRA